MVLYLCALGEGRGAGSLLSHSGRRAVRVGWRLRVRRGGGRAWGEWPAAEMTMGQELGVWDWEEEAGEGLGAVAGAENDDGPGVGVVGFEEEADGTAAGHADVALEVPFGEAVGLGVGDEGAGFGDGFVFDFAAADGAVEEAVGG